jgi:hypothetical protein
MKRVVTACALASTLALATVSTALAAGPPVLVSHGDPFAACKPSVGANGSARYYRSAEIEPWVAANPADTNNIIGTWQQDRWSDGGARGQVASWSFDGGRTWGQTPQPFTTCAQPFYSTPVLQYERTSDPWVSIGPDGTAYAASLPFDGDFIRSGLWAAVSHDGGRTWVNQQDIDPLIANPDTFDPSDDKQAVTADPTLPGFAYMVWDRIVDIFPPCPAAATRAAVRSGGDTRRGVTRAAAVTTAAPAPCPGGLFSGPGYFSRTTDGGRHWSKPELIIPTGVNQQTIGNQIVIDRQSGVLYDFFNFIDLNGPQQIDNIQMVVSTNHGKSWSKPRQVQRLATTAELRACNCGVVYPGDESKPLRTGDIIQSVAIDPNTGQLYVVWEDGTPNAFQNDMLLASTSTDHGLTWSLPTLVNPPNDKAAFTGAVAVNSRGQVGVLYYDFTPALPADKSILPTDTWFVATDGPGLHFGARTLVGGPFNMEAAPFARGFFTGDYMGLTAKVQDTSGDQSGPNQDEEPGGGFVSLFVMTNCQDNSCRAVGTHDGTSAGPDSTDAFSART